MSTFAAAPTDLPATAATTSSNMAGTSILATFQKHIEDMRNLSLCKICIKPFYEPFILPCGHTYCYSCLTSWFGGAQGRKSKKSCPDCRAKVRTQPSPNYLLRDLVHMFIGRAELLPEDETVQEHQKAKEEEAVLLAADRAGPGLFKGVFLGPQLLRDWRRGILDSEDNVVRCPDCHWELEDGGCNRCGFHEFDNSGSGSEPDDLSDESIHPTDSELDGEDDIDLEFSATMGHTGHDYHYDEMSPATFSSDDDDDDDDDDEDNEMHDFIDNEGVEGDSEADTESTMTVYNRQFANNEDDDHASISSGRSVDTIERFGGYHLNRPDHYASDVHATTNDDQSDAATNYDELTEASDYETAPTQTSLPRSRITRVILSDDDDDDEPEIDESIPGGHGTEEEDEDGEASELSGTEPAHDYSDSEESDSSVRPPQPSAQRRQHLHNQQARRNNYSIQPHNQGIQRRIIPARQQYPQHQRGNGFQQSRGGRGNASRYQPYQRPYGRQIRVGGNTGYSY